MKYFLFTTLVAFSLCLSGCLSDKDSDEVISEGSRVAKEDNKEENPFIKYPGTPFGNFDVYATKGVPEAKVLYASHVFSQWLDNDEDGEADNPAVVQKMKDANVVMVLATLEDGNYDRMIRRWIPGRVSYFGAYGGEIHPDAIVNGVVVGPHCGTWEEFFHHISDIGFAGAYPEVFGCEPGTELCNAMDFARGGQFMSVPRKYPDDAWYYYDDEGCSYGCQASEYIYWLMGTLLGAHDHQCDQIQREWKPCNAEELKKIDPIGYALVTNPKYKFPTRLPDGHYDGKIY